MAEKKAAQSKKEQFSDAVYDLGLTLVDRYISGKFNVGDGRTILETIVEIFQSAQQGNDKRD